MIKLLEPITRLELWLSALGATATTEQTTAHTLNSYEGTTVVEADTNVDPVMLACEFMTSA